MTITNTDRQITYTGNGVTTVFSYGFKIPAADDLNVALFEIATGVLSAPLDAGLYLVTGLGDDAGGNITYPITGTPVASTHKLVIYRSVPQEQNTSFTNQSAYLPEVLEDQLDSLVMMAQELSETVSRSIQVTLGSDDDPATLIATLTAQSAAATVSAAAAAADAVSTAADVVSTNADVVSTNADAVSTAADAVQTALDVIATAADVVSTAADVVSTNADVVTITGSASTTSLLIEVASKAFTVASGLGFQAGDWILVTSDADITNYMHGQIASYSGTTLTLTVDNIGGSGTFADWTIRRSGTRGSSAGIGVGQEWTNVTGSRTYQTSYQNTTGTPIMVNVSVESLGNSSANDVLQASTDNSTWITVTEGRNSGDRTAHSMIVPDNHYYKFNLTNVQATILNWSELR